MGQNKTPWSTYGLGPNATGIVDIAALSLNARYKIIKQIISFSLTNGVSHNLGALGVKGTVVAAWASNRTVGTYTAATIQLVNLTQTLNITNTLDPSTVLTSSGNIAFAIATTNPVNAASDAIVLAAAGTFTVQPVEMQITIVVDPSEAASPINQ